MAPGTLRVREFGRGGIGSAVSARLEDFCCAPRRPTPPAKHILTPSGHAGAGEPAYLLVSPSAAPSSRRGSGTHRFPSTNPVGLRAASRTAGVSVDGSLMELSWRIPGCSEISNAIVTLSLSNCKRRHCTAGGQFRTLPFDRDDRSDRCCAPSQRRIAQIVPLRDAHKAHVLAGREAFGGEGANLKFGSLYEDQSIVVDGDRCRGSRSRYRNTGPGSNAQAIQQWLINDYTPQTINGKLVGPWVMKRNMVSGFERQIRFGRFFRSHEHGALGLRGRQRRREEY